MPEMEATSAPPRCQLVHHVDAAPRKLALQHPTQVGCAVERRPLDVHGRPEATRQGEGALTVEVEADAALVHVIVEVPLSLQASLAEALEAAVERGQPRHVGEADTRSPP